MQRLVMKVIKPTICRDVFTFTLCRLCVYLLPVTCIAYRSGGVGVYDYVTLPPSAITYRFYWYMAARGWIKQTYTHWYTQNARPTNKTYIKKLLEVS